MDDIFNMKLRSGTACVSGGFGFGKEINTYGGSSQLQVLRLSPSCEDYSEIFGSFHGSRSSSIPIINIPAVDGGEIFSDTGTSELYGEVFRGFDALDFEIPHEDEVSTIESRTRVTHLSSVEQSGDKKPPLQIAENNDWKQGFRAEMGNENDHRTWNGDGMRVEGSETEKTDERP